METTVMPQGEIDATLVSIVRAAELLDTSQRSVWRLIESGELRAVHLSTRQTRVRLVDVIALIERRST